MAYKTGRPKGLAPWKPQKGTRVILNQVQEVLDQYRQHWPLTIRQIFYRLVGIYSYEKTERGYGRLSDYLNRGRRAGIIPWKAIRDDGIVKHGSNGYTDSAEFLEVVANSARWYKRDKQRRQPIRIIIMVEAAGMVPQIVKAVNPYGLTVISSSGFDSLTVKHELAEDIIGDERPTVILHIGDLDPSGVCIFDSVRADIEAFIEGADVKFKRIALTPEQVTRYSLPTTPAKKTDKRGNGITMTCQAEALPPDILAQIVKTEVLFHYDMEQYESDVEAEINERCWLVERFEDLTAEN